MKSNLDIDEVLARLVKLQLFADFNIRKAEDRRILTQVFDSLQKVQFKKGSQIIKEGESGDTFYILLEGSVFISRTTPAGDQIALANLDSTQNIFFGETALVGKDTRSATVTAKTDCTTLVLNTKNFEELAEKEPVLGYRVFKVLSHRLMKTVRETNFDKATLYQALFNEIARGE
ncbi:MAG: cyclic nucleotide-binding domain-containing protein [Treponema sp.]|nr:cyclic nucleotide-binding domain-containing protein [Treponema sp.]